MTPFGEMLEKYRRKRAMRQYELASLLGVAPAYISALEIGTRGPPAEEIISRIILKLELRQEEIGELREAIRLSKATLRLPKGASTNEYRLMHSLVHRLGTLSDGQIKALNAILTINEQGKEVKMK